MRVLDIRKEQDIDIEGIRISPPDVEFTVIDMLWRGIHYKSYDRNCIVLQDSDTEEELTVETKENAQYLIQALEKAIELGWVE